MPCSTIADATGLTMPVSTYSQSIEEIVARLDVILVFAAPFSLTPNKIEHCGLCSKLMRQIGWISDNFRDCMSMLLSKLVLMYIRAILSSAHRHWLMLLEAEGTADSQPFLTRRSMRRNWGYVKCDRNDQSNFRFWILDFGLGKLAQQSKNQMVSSLNVGTYCNTKLKSYLCLPFKPI